VSVSQETKSQPATRSGWHAADVSTVARELGVEPERGLSVEEARRRLQSQGPNKLTAAKKESGLQAFLRQYRDVMQLILLAAALVSLLVTGDVATAAVLAGLTVFNAVIGLRQEIDAEELVPGDVVLMEAGNRVPADGRISVAATFEIEEAALTGESLPVAKGTEPVLGDEVALGDRTGMAYMNTSVTRGRGEMIVTATGMDTEIGHIADLLAKTETDKTPLQKQLDGLSKIIAAIAGVALLLVIAVTTVGFLEQIFDTVELSFSQWSICIGIAASLVVVEELIKLVLRQRDRRRVAAAPRLSASRA
jgi:P-type Ca2+ transporter type 2C